MPFQLLRDAFELQTNALENCAAACVCKSWQIVAYSSFVSGLHLHIHNIEALPSGLVQWRAYLAARSSIGELTLTAGGSAVCHRYGNYLDIEHHLNPLACVPADCNSLTVDEHFAPFVADYTEQPARLQHLAIRYRVHPTDISGRDPADVLRDLSHLTQLRSLKIEAPDGGLVNMKHFPVSLTSLYVGGWEETGISVNLPNHDLHWRRESECLRRLASLEFHMCQVHVGVGSTEILLGLTSLSISQCAVDRRIDAVLNLTNLRSLDLTGVRTQGGVRGTPLQEGQEPWSSFVAWPALHVFKFAGCWLIDKSTALDIATVQEVHTDRLALGMGTANVHLVVRDRHAIVLGSLASLLSPAWCTHVMELCVVVTDSPDVALRLTFIVNQMLVALLCLQSFHLFGGCDSYGQSVRCGQGQIVLGKGYSGQLKDLQLQDLFFHTLDLGMASCLTSISLSNIDQPCVSCELILPSCLVQLEFAGNSLTTRHAKCVLEGLPSLTHITLGFTHIKVGTDRCQVVGEPELSSSACLPTMPGSLLWLSVTSESLKQLLDGSAQDCLRFCTSLEYLILPLGQDPVGELYEWVKGARYVRISGNDPEEILCCRDAHYA